MFYRYGRINRPTYFVIFGLLVAAFAAVIYFVNDAPRIAEICFLPIGVARLHDIGKSGWWAGGVILAELAVVLVALPFAISMHNTDVILIAGGLFVMVVLGLMVWLGCISGQPGANQYGEPSPPGLSLKTLSRPKPQAVKRPNEV